MNTLERLEDKRLDWQEACAPALEECLTVQATRLAAILPNPVGPLTPDQKSGLADVNDRVRAWAGQDLLARCLTWLGEAKLWPAEPPDEFVRRELAAAHQHLPALELPHPEPSLRVPVVSWAAAAAVGAAVGMLLLTPLSLLLLGQREAGLCLGGMVGSAALVTLVGALSGWPRMRTAVSTILAAAGVGSLVGGIWAYCRGRSTGWLRASAGFLAIAFVIILARPRRRWPGREEYLDAVRRQLRPHLRHVADLTLAWCWAHPARQPAPPPAADDRGAALPGRACAALADLHAQLASSGSADDLRDSVEELLQRFEDDGYEWKTVAANTPYDEAMKEDFDSFGIITPGQPVRTRRAAVRRRGQVIRKGELFRV